MLIRSDEAKTWRYRGKNVNQLKSLTLKAFSRPVLYTRGIMDQLSNWFVSDRRSDQGVDLTQLSSMAFLGLLPNQWSWHSDWRTLDAGKIHFVFCNSFSAYFHFERSIQYPGWQSFVFLFQYMQHQQQDVFVFIYICNISRMFFPVNTASGLTKVMCLTFATFFFGSVLHKCTRTICHLS